MPDHLLEHTGEPQSGPLTEEQMDAIVDGLYEGDTLRSVLRKLDIKRLHYDLARRDNAEFAEAITLGTKALLDILAEKSYDDLQTCIDDNNGSVQDRRLRLMAAQKQAAHVQWMASRASGTFRTRRPEEAEKEKPKDMQTHVSRGGDKWQASETSPGLPPPTE